MLHTKSMVDKFKHRFFIKQLLIWSLNLTQNADPHKCKYSGYGIGFDSRSKFLFTNENMGKNVIVFGADMSLSVHIDNKKLLSKS